MKKLKYGKDILYYIDEKNIKLYAVYESETPVII